jgi:hypothetical protein
VQRIAESIAYYASRLPPYASVHRILAFGDKLVQRGEHRLALEACYSYVKQLNIHQRGVVRADELTCLSWHVQACYGVATCEAKRAFAQDPQMKHPDTLASVVACLHQLKDVLVLVLPSEQLYWITLNGTLHIYTLAKRLLTAGFVAQMLPFMVFCVKALESHVIFSTSKYLTWRTQLYISLCYAYCDVREHGMAKQVRRLSGPLCVQVCMQTTVLPVLRVLQLTGTQHGQAGQAHCASTCSCMQVAHSKTLAQAAHILVKVSEKVCLRFQGDMHHMAVVEHAV